GHDGRGGHGGSGASSGGGATAQGDMEGSPGVVSGNGLQLPVQLPVNVSGNSVNVVGIGDPAFGNTSVNTSGEKPEQPGRRPPTRHAPPVQPGPKANPSAPAVESGSRGPEARSSLAHTGADATLTALTGSTAMVLGGALLYRRFRPGAQR
ncbi:chaplin family protein, partial [Streptomyces sp. NPDC002491]